MYNIAVYFDVQPEHRDDFIAASLEDGRTSGANEPGTRRFELIADEAERAAFYLLLAVPGIVNCLEDLPDAELRDALRPVVYRMLALRRRPADHGTSSESITDPLDCVGHVEHGGDVGYPGGAVVVGHDGKEGLVERVRGADLA